MLSAPAAWQRGAREDLAPGAQGVAMERTPRGVDEPDQAHHLGQRAGALILNLVVAQVQLGELVVRVLLQRARQLRGA
jgi:hypothetical protein